MRRDPASATAERTGHGHGGTAAGTGSTCRRRRYYPLIAALGLPILGYGLIFGSWLVVGAS